MHYGEEKKVKFFLLFFLNGTLRTLNRITSRKIKTLFGIVFVTAFHQILNFFFAKIKCG